MITQPDFPPRPDGGLSLRRVAGRGWGVKPPVRVCTRRTPGNFETKEKKMGLALLGLPLPHNVLGRVRRGLAPPPSSCSSPVPPRACGLMRVRCRRGVIMPDSRDNAELMRLEFQNLTKVFLLYPVRIGGCRFTTPGPCVFLGTGPAVSGGPKACEGNIAGYGFA